MPSKLEVRTRFKQQLLQQSLEVTQKYAFAPPQGTLSTSDQCIVAGDYNMTFSDVDAALRGATGQ